MATATSTSTSSPPPSSPRHPSPPPFAEVQIAPPPLNLNSSTTSKPPTSSNTSTSCRRIRPGTKSHYVSSGAPLTALTDLDSAFQLQEHLASLITSITHPPGSDSTHPLSRVDCTRLATPPENTEDSLWCYELTRRLTRDLNILIVALLNDHCTAQTCPEMRASEWQYLCAAHESPQSCCAIDYSTHTLDQAATMLTSTKYFPSRLSIHSTATKHIVSIFRRLYRIFAHAWFQHRHVFWEVEGEYGLYLFFKAVSDRYRLIPEDNLMLPPEAEGLNVRNGEAGDEEEDEEEGGDFGEWDRRTELKHGTEREQEDQEERDEGEVERGDSDEDDDEEAYSDESESDEEGGEEDEVADPEGREQVMKAIEEDSGLDEALWSAREEQFEGGHPAEAQAPETETEKEHPKAEEVEKDVAEADDTNKGDEGAQTQAGEPADKELPEPKANADSNDSEVKDEEKKE